MDTGPSSIIFELLFLFILILINAFLSATEIAVVSLNKNRINYLAEEGNKKAKQILKLTGEPSKFFGTIQVGITLAGFLASASATATISKRLAIVLKNSNISWLSNSSDGLAIAIVTIVLAYFTLVIGELVPKRLGVQNSEKVSMFAIKPIMFIYKISSPFVKFLTWSSNIMSSLLGINAQASEESVSKEEIKLIIDEGEEKGVIDKEEKEMIEGVMDFDDTMAKEVMMPRTEVFMLSVDMPMSEVIERVLQEKYSRIPVYEDEPDNIIGILYMKDLFFQVTKHKLEDIKLKDILRKAYFIPETKSINLLFKELKESKSHMAILIDEYGGFSGIVTIEDLIEEVMGNIFDEYDEEHNYYEEIKKIDNSTYLVSGLLSIDDLNEKLDLELPSEHFDTIGGLVMDLIGSIPLEQEEYVVEYKNVVFKVEKVDDKRIELVKVCIN